MGVGVGLAELMVTAFLPAPVPQRLPFVRVQADDLCGYRLLPNHVGYALSGLVTTNRQGFRGRDWETEKAPDAVRVALLGDSLVFGQGVNDEETIGAQLEEILNDQAKSGVRFEVLNFGVSGYDTGHEIQVLKHYALQFHPDIVLLHFFLNDLLYVSDYSFYGEMFEQAEREFSWWKWQLREAARKSRLLMALWDLWQDRQDNPMTRLVHAYVYKGVVPPDGPGSDGWAFVENRLRELADLSRIHKFKAALVILPLPHEIHDTEVRATYPAFLVERSRVLGITPVQVLRDLRVNGGDPLKLLIPYDNHFSKVGSRVVAESLARPINVLMAEDSSGGVPGLVR